MPLAAGPAAASSHAGKQATFNNITLMCGLPKATSTSPPRVFWTLVSWTSLLIVAQLTSVRYLLTDREAYFTRHRTRMIRLLRGIRMLSWYHMSLTFGAAPLYAADSLPRVLVLHTGALFSFEHVMALPLPFDWCARRRLFFRCSLSLAFARCAAPPQPVRAAEPAPPHENCNIPSSSRSPAPAPFLRPPPLAGSASSCWRPSPAA
jgi:hypothetical protein